MRWRPAECWTVDFSLQLLAKSVICSVFESTSGEVAKTQLSEPPTARGSENLTHSAGCHSCKEPTENNTLGSLVMYFRHITVFLVEEMHYLAGASL